MKLIKHEFPNPVLGSGRDDYIESCKFYTSIIDEKISVDETMIHIPVTYTLKCEGITKLVNEGRAKIIIVAESKAANYRRIFSFSLISNDKVISIPKYDVVTSIVLTGNIVAAESISQFTCPGELNPLYFSSSTFEIRKGDILGTEYKHTIYIDDTELEKPIQSICQIVRDEKTKKPIEAFYTPEKIDIHLNSELYDKYDYFANAYNGALSRYTTVAIIFPVLVEAISRMREDARAGNDEDLDSRWYRAIEKKVAAIEDGIVDWTDDSYSPVDIANRLVGNVAHDSLSKLKDFIDRHLIGTDDFSFGGGD